jgi:hypothetical protein
VVQLGEGEGDVAFFNFPCGAYHFLGLARASTTFVGVPMTLRPCSTHLNTLHLTSYTSAHRTVPFSQVLADPSLTSFCSRRSPPRWTSTIQLGPHPPRPSPTSSTRRPVLPPS